MLVYMTSTSNTKLHTSSNTNCYYIHELHTNTFPCICCFPNQVHRNPHPYETREHWWCWEEGRGGRHSGRREGTHGRGMGEKRYILAITQSCIQCFVIVPVHWLLEYFCQSSQVTGIAPTSNIATNSIIEHECRNIAIWSKTLCCCKVGGREYLYNNSSSHWVTTFQKLENLSAHLREWMGTWLHDTQLHIHTQSWNYTTCDIAFVVGERRAKDKYMCIIE